MSRRSLPRNPDVRIIVERLLAGERLTGPVAFGSGRKARRFDFGWNGRVHEDKQRINALIRQGLATRVDTAEGWEIRLVEPPR